MGTQLPFMPGVSSAALAVPAAVRHTLPTRQARSLLQTPLQREDCQTSLMLERTEAACRAALAPHPQRLGQQLSDPGWEDAAGGSSGPWGYLS